MLSLHKELSKKSYGTAGPLKKAILYMSRTISDKNVDKIFPGRDSWQIRSDPFLVRASIMYYSRVKFGLMAKPAEIFHEMLTMFAKALPESSAID
jgi:hypothetical protein